MFVFKCVCLLFLHGVITELFWLLFGMVDITLDQHIGYFLFRKKSIKPTGYVEIRYSRGLGHKQS